MWRSGPCSSLPSTLMWSRSMSALVPNSVMIWPLTVTRPWAISSSTLRREAMPAAAMIFCRRSSGKDLTTFTFRCNLAGGLFVGAGVLRIGRDSRFGHILGDLGFVLRHLFYATILRHFGNSRGIGDSGILGREQIVLLVSAKFFELFNAGKL